MISILLYIYRKLLSVEHFEGSVHTTLGEYHDTQRSPNILDLFFRKTRAGTYMLIGFEKLCFRNANPPVSSM